MASMFGTMIHPLDSRRSVESQGFRGNENQRADSQETEETEVDQKPEEESDTHGEQREEERLKRRISGLARTFTRNSTKAGQHGKGEENTFLNITDERLDPNSPNFNAKEWIKNLVSVQSSDPERYPSRTAGVLFRDLSVHGFGSPTDYQKDVANVLLEVAALPRYLLGSGKRKIQILRNFDGVIKSGELLVVLGRPGR